MALRPPPPIPDRHNRPPAPPRPPPGLHRQPRQRPPHPQVPLPPLPQRPLPPHCPLRLPRIRHLQLRRPPLEVPPPDLQPRIQHQVPPHLRPLRRPFRTLPPPPPHPLLRRLLQLHPRPPRPPPALRLRQHLQHRIRPRPPLPPPLPLPNTLFASSFDDAVRISSERFNCVLPLFWKTKKFLNVGSERRLKNAISLVRDFARTIVKQKKKEFINLTNNNNNADDLLSRLILRNNNGGEDETLGVDMVISFILAGRDTTSAALTWFFWLVSRNPRVEAEILKEIKGIEEEGSRDDGGMMVYEEVRREMGYTEAALCESMRLYPPVPTDTKEAAEDDVLPDGTEVRKGTRVAYHPYTMGRMEGVWGEDWGSTGLRGG
ncbi:hypothetical protein Scep_017693 [Stephania cephalantha]|uniref:Cytochrome P450 n=1 Tax=Stephania cephalantha TaxID=152367 RepID=A0AAP0IQJ9_9MAGN